MQCILIKNMIICAFVNILKIISYFEWNILNFGGCQKSGKREGLPILCFIINDLQDVKLMIYILKYFNIKSNNIKWLNIK